MDSPRLASSSCRSASVYIADEQKKRAASSTELRAQQSTDFVSPMNLHYIDIPQEPYSNQAMDDMSSQTSHSMNHEYYPPRGSTSAPAHIAFHTSPSLPLPSPGELDFDISPLTSPWLGAHQQTFPPRLQTNKRTASPSGDESPVAKPSRKKQSPAIRPTLNVTKKPLRGCMSTNSTPLIRSTRARRGSAPADSILGDTPSPVDLSMPPPAPPSNQMNSGGMHRTTAQTPEHTPHLTPVTPASIMNLGRLSFNNGISPTVLQPQETTASGKRAAKASLTVETSSLRTKPSKRASAGPAFSPGLKQILPGMFFPISQVRHKFHPVPL
jgi:hypothetical protein